MRPAVVDRRNPQTGAASTAFRLLAVSVVAVALIGCGNKHRKAEIRAWAHADVSERHPIVVDRREVDVALPIPRGAQGLSRPQADEVRAFVRQFKSASDGRLRIRAPRGTPNEVAAMRALAHVRALIRKEDVPPQATSFTTYHGHGDPEAPIRLSFLHYVAEGPECGEWPRDLTKTWQNMPFHNFGCATQRNLAAMTANPRDLLQPRGMTPRSSERRDVTWDKYVKGETTAAEKSEEEKAKVSDVSGGGN